MSTLHYLFKMFLHAEWKCEKEESNYICWFVISYKSLAAITGNSNFFAWAYSPVTSIGSADVNLAKWLFPTGMQS